MPWNEWKMTTENNELELFIDDIFEILRKQK